MAAAGLQLGLILPIPPRVDEKTSPSNAIPNTFRKVSSEGPGGSEWATDRNQISVMGHLQLCSLANFRVSKRPGLLPLGS